MNMASEHDQDYEEEIEESVKEVCCMHVDLHEFGCESTICRVLVVNVTACIVDLPSALLD